MPELDFTGFANRPPLAKILMVPAKVQSVYSLTQHVWEGETDEALVFKNLGWVFELAD
jgi:hypothetical protein